jgi:hypothetical protein
MPSEIPPQRHELASLLARVVYRLILPPQKFPQSSSDRLETAAQKSLSDTSVVNSVTNHGESGEP